MDGNVTTSVSSSSGVESDCADDNVDRVDWAAVDTSSASDDPSGGQDRGAAEVQVADKGSQAGHEGNLSEGDSASTNGTAFPVSLNDDGYGNKTFIALNTTFVFFPYEWHKPKRPKQARARFL